MEAGGLLVGPCERRQLRLGIQRSQEGQADGSARAAYILQRTVFKYRKRRVNEEYAKAHRVFRRAPLHHHFELKGWHEVQVVIRFWILGILCAFLALTTLKLR